MRPYNKPELYALFQRLEFVKLIDKYGLRSVAAEAPKKADAPKALPRCEELPAEKLPCAVYLAEYLKSSLLKTPLISLSAKSLLITIGATIAVTL